MDYTKYYELLEKINKSKNKVQVTEKFKPLIQNINSKKSEDDKILDQIEDILDGFKKLPTYEIDRIRKILIKIIKFNDYNNYNEWYKEKYPALNSPHDNWVKEVYNYIEKYKKQKEKPVENKELDKEINNEKTENKSSISILLSRE